MTTLTSLERVPLIAGAIAAASLVWSVDPYSTLSGLLGFGMLSMLIWAARRMGQNTILAVLRILVTATILGSLIATAVAPMEAYLNGRLRGIFQNPNEFGVLLALSIPLIVARNGKWWSTAFGAGIVFMLILATGSRGAFLAAAAAMFVFLSKSAVLDPLRKALLLVSLTSLFVLFAFYWQEIVEVLGSSQYETFRMNNSRAEVWGRGLEEVGALWPLGAGYSAMDSIPGSSLLKTLGEFGIFGLLLLCFTLWAMVTAVRQSHAMVASLVATALVSGIFEAWVLTPGSVLCIILWVAVQGGAPGRAKTALKRERKLHESSLVR